MGKYLTAILVAVLLFSGTLGMVTAHDNHNSRPTPTPTPSYHNSHDDHDDHDDRDDHNDRDHRDDDHDNDHDDHDGKDHKKSPSPRPTSTPSATPSATPVPVITPDPNDKCTNIDGVQTSIPEGWFQISPDSTFCRQFQYGGPQAPSSNPGAPQGQVLGASTMAGTGSFAETFYQAIMGVGALLTIKGVKKFKK